MPDENTTENLRRFLESDDPAKVLMGLSMVKGVGADPSLLGLILGLCIYGEEGEVRDRAGAAFIESAPDGLAELPGLFPAEKQTAILRLVDHGDAAVPMLVAALEIALGCDSLYMNDAQHDFCSLIVTALDQLGDARAIPVLIRVVQNWTTARSIRHHSPVSAAMAALVQFGTEAVDSLVLALEADGGNGVALVLAEIGDSRAVSSLIGVLIEQEEDEFEIYEYSAAYTEALLKLAEQKPIDQRSIERLREAGGSWPSLVLARLGLADVAAIEELGWCLRFYSDSSSSPNFGEAFQAALVEIGTAAVEPLLNVLKHEDFSEHDEAIRILGEIGDKRAVETLIAVLNREAPFADIRDEEAYLKVVWSLGEIGDKRAIQPLIAAMEGLDECDRESFNEALIKLGHEVDQPNDEGD